MSHKNNPKYLRLSYSLQEDSPIHPALSKVKITPKNQMKRGDDYNTYFIYAENHSGTHVDAPAHFLKEGRIISSYGPDELTFGNLMVLDCPKNPDDLVTEKDISKALLKFTGDKNIDVIFVRTGFIKYRKRGTEKYLEKNPGIAPEAVLYLRKTLPGLACVGIDSVSMSRYGRQEEAVMVHQNAFKESENLGKPLLLVEDLDLEPLTENNEIEEVIIIPWQVGRIDSAPCTVLARLKKEE